MFQVCDVRWSDNEVFIAMKGDLDHGAIGVFRADLRRLVRESPRLVIDVFDMDLSDPSGPGLLLGLAYYASERDKEIVIEGAPDSLRRLLKIARFDRPHARAVADRRRVGTRTQPKNSPYSDYDLVCHVP